MKYDSIHRFSSMADAAKFLDFILKNGFKRVGLAKNGGIIFENDKFYKLMVCVQP